MPKPRKHPPIPVIVVVLLVIIGGCVWWWVSAHPSATASGLSADGTVEATEYDVTPAIAAPIASVAVKEGDTVAKGDTVATLDSKAAALQVSQAQQGVTAAQAALDNVTNDSSSTKADKTAAQARLAQAKAAVELAQVQVSYATVKAPAAGVVTSVIGQAGENASPGRTLVTILDTTNLYANVYVPETSIGQVKTGEKVSLTTDSSTATFTGTVSFIASQAQFTPDTIQTADARAKLVYEVRIDVTDSSGTLKAGLPVTAEFQ